MSESPTPKRCDWAGNDPDMVAYHDTEWGVPVHDDTNHFEFLVLEGAQAGLSWSTILKRRAGYRKAFAGFDAAKVARFTPARVEKLLLDPGIIRNRAKVESTVRNARALPGRAEGVRLLRRLHLGLRGRADAGQQVAPNGAAPRRSAPSRRPSAPICAAGASASSGRPLLRPPAGHRAGQRPPGRLLPLRRAHRLRAIRTRAPKRDMTGSSGGRPWARRKSSTGPRSTKPSEA